MRGCIKFIPINVSIRYNDLLSTDNAVEDNMWTIHKTHNMCVTVAIARLKTKAFILGQMWLHSLHSPNICLDQQSHYAVLNVLCVRNASCFVVRVSSRIYMTSWYKQKPEVLLGKLTCTTWKIPKNTIMCPVRLNSSQGPRREKTNASLCLTTKTDSKLICCFF